MHPGIIDRTLSQINIHERKVIPLFLTRLTRYNTWPIAGYGSPELVWRLATMQRNKGIKDKTNRQHTKSPFISTTLVSVRLQ